MTEPSPDIYDRYQALAERANECRAWARNRIACCNAALTGRIGEISRYSATGYAAEQQALEAVLRILDGKETP